MSGPLYMGCDPWAMVTPSRSMALWGRHKTPLGPLLAIVVSSLLLPLGCDDASSDTDAEDAEDSAKKKKTKKKADPDGEPAASAAGSAAAAPSSSSAVNDPTSASGGPTVTIPAGTLRAGSRCYDIPRVRPDELEHTEMAFGAFDMDVFPYPNEPGQPAKVDVTWQEAKELCEARGKRLCTELEWERACKGPKNHTYPWGDAFQTGKCEGRKDRLTNERSACKSEHEVMDLVGLSLEWTASDWERGTPNGQKVVRGARSDVVSWLSARCAYSRMRDPNKKFDNVGFRCCRGPENTAKVQLRLRQRTTIEDESSIDAQFEMTLMKAMPKDHRGIVGVELSFDEVWRWHPVPNEEMLVARWKGKPENGGAFYEIAVFKLCGDYAYRAASMRGPVERIGKPKVGVDATKLSFELTTGSRSGPLELSYWHGHVKLKEPEFVKKGNQLKVASAVTTKRRRNTVKVRPK